MAIVHLNNQVKTCPIGWIIIDEFSSFEACKGSDDDVWLINTCLNWNGQKLSSFYGFYIAQLIRTKKKSKSPIIFYSPLPKEYFEQKSEKEIKYKMLFGRATGYLEAPFNETQLNALIKEIQPLTKAALHDEVTMLCDLKGIVIEKINHNLKFGSNIDAEIDSIRPYLSEEQKVIIGLDAFVNEIKSINEDIRFNEIRQLFVEKCNFRLTLAAEYTPLSNKDKFKILIVDDEPEELAKAAKYLKNHFDVITASTVRDAMNILMADSDNYILSVISDWRLFTDERKMYWQPLQGYEVLEMAAKTGIRSLFALTSQASFLIHQIRNLMGLHFPLFQKQNLINEGQWKVLADALMEACETTKELIESQPTSDQWYSRMRKKKDLGISLKEVYAIKRHTKSKYFSDIDDRCDEIWRIFLDAPKRMRSLLGKLSTTLINEDVLKEVFVQRRIWIALFQNGNSPDKIYELMSKDPHKSSTTSDVTQLKIKLCIVEDDIKYRRFLPEEKAWFRKWNLID